MKPLLTPLTLIVLAISIASCGGTSTHTSSSTTSYSTEPKAFDSDDAPIRFYGHPADTADKQAITTLLKRYYAAAASENGTKACPLIDSLIAETIVEDDGHQPALLGTTCAVVMSKLFTQHHQQLVTDSATFEMTSIRVEGGKALALVRFAKAPVPDYIPVHREGSTWKVWELFAGQLP